MHESHPEDSGRRRRAFLLFAALTFSVVAASAIVSIARRANAPEGPVASVVDDARLAEIGSAPHLLFRDYATASTRGRLAVVPLDDPSATRVIVPVEGERVHAGPGRVFVLQRGSAGMGIFSGLTLDAEFRAIRPINLAGVPSRTRVSRDGRVAAATGFVSGDSYDPGGFSTRTTFVDLDSGKYLASLADFRILRDGREFTAEDLNFWGVTFAREEGRFFATASTGGIPWLIEGDLARREATMLSAGVECPSLSPDGTRIAFKSRRATKDGVEWGLRVLDLRSRAEIDIAEPRNVDDQVEWLDDTTILYAVARRDGQVPKADIWASPADGGAAPRLFVRDAASPCVRRP